MTSEMNERVDKSQCLDRWALFATKSSVTSPVNKATFGAPFGCLDSVSELLGYTCKDQTTSSLGPPEMASLVCKKWERLMRKWWQEVVLRDLSKVTDGAAPRPSPRLFLTSVLPSPRLGGLTFPGPKLLCAYCAS